VFHQFSQAKFADGGSTLSLSNILPVPAALKNGDHFKSSQNRLKNNQLATLI
jgi:hypothetical protein